MTQTSSRKPSRYRPLKGELVAEQDSSAMRASRERAERLLREMVEKISKEETIEHPVVLALFDYDDDQVEIGCWRRRYTKNDHTRLTYVLSTSTTWIDAATDGQMRAVFAHELGHVVLGDCEEIEDWAIEAYGAYLEHLETLYRRMWFGFTALAVLSLVLPFMKAPTQVQMGVDVLMSIQLVAVLGLWGWKMKRLLPESFEERINEYEADAFCVRFADPVDMVSDLERSTPTRWAHIQEWFSWPVSSHPPLRARARAMGVDWQQYRKRSARAMTPALAHHHIRHYIDSRYLDTSK